MNDTPEQFLNTLRSIGLSAQEKATMRARLGAFTQSHVPHRSVWRGVFAFTIRHAVVSVFVLLLLLAGGVSTLAQNARPGDPLYSVKVQINDRVAVAVAVGEDNKTDLELVQIDRAIAQESAAAERELMQESEDQDASANSDELADVSSELDRLIHEINAEIDFQADLEE